MAYALQSSRFVGVDLAAGPVAAGQQSAADLGLSNLALHAADLREIGPASGEFDYIVAHGVYSWVPPDVREALLAVCRDRLAPGGIAFVSYNTYPGGHVRQMLREMLLYHTRHLDQPAGRIAAAREFLHQLARSRLLSPPWQTLRDHEVNALLARDDAGLYHDELAEFNDRFYFHEFAAAARRHDLQYLGEAEPHEMFDPSGAFPDQQADLIEREQHLDFVKARRFRQTLLTRAGHPLRREIRPEQMAEFLFSAPARLLGNGQIEGSRGVRLTPSNDTAVRVAVALGEVDPLPVAFDDLLPYSDGAGPLCEILCSLVLAGFADLHVYDFPCQDIVTARPRASRLVRHQAGRSRYVTSACHMAVELDETARSLVQLLDGARTHHQIARAVGAGRSLEGVRATLEWMASRGLLEG
jgi:SAM-dependent methyltransferase